MIELKMVQHEHLKLSKKRTNSSSLKHKLNNVISLKNASKKHRNVNSNYIVFSSENGFGDVSLICHDI